MHAFLDADKVTESKRRKRQQDACTPWKCAVVFLQLLLSGRELSPACALTAADLMWHIFRFPKDYEPQKPERHACFHAAKCERMQPDILEFLEGVWQLWYWHTSLTEQRGSVDTRAWGGFQNTWHLDNIICKYSHRHRRERFSIWIETLPNIPYCITVSTILPLILFMKIS